MAAADALWVAGIGRSRFSAEGELLFLLSNAAVDLLWKDLSITLMLHHRNLWEHRDSTSENH